MIQLKKTLAFSALLCLIGTGSMNGQTASGQNDKVKDAVEDLAKKVQIDAYAQGGFVYEHTGGQDKNTFELKRSIMTVAVPINDRWFAFFMHDFSSVVQEYYATYRVTNNKALSVKLGQFKNALSYENAQSPTGMEAIDVYADGVTFLTGCGSDRLMGTQYGRDLGLSFFGQSTDGKFKYEVEVMNGQGVNRKDLNNEKDFIGKLEYSPVEGLNLIASGQIGRGHAVEHSIYNPTISVGENYKRNRWTAGFAYNSKPIKLHGEYLEGRDGCVTSRGAYLTTTIPVAPKWDAVASYDFFNFNTDLDMDQHKFIAGLQYWIYKRCRVQMQYVYKSASVQNGEFRHGANHALMAQLQIRLR